MAKAIKKQKQRTDKYKKKLAITGTLDDVMGVAFKGADEAVKAKDADKKAKEKQEKTKS